MFVAPGFRRAALEGDCSPLPGIAPKRCRVFAVPGRASTRQHGGRRPLQAESGRVRMGKYKAKTQATVASVTGFIDSIENDSRREDARTLVRIFKDATGWQPRMWGPSIIGFGVYHYTYDSGHSGSMCATGFSPRKANFAIYAADFPGRADLLKKLGKHRSGAGQCLYVNKLADVRVDVLAEILRKSLVELRKQWPVTVS
jgi:hypothetical protein